MVQAIQYKYSQSSPVIRAAIDDMVRIVRDSSSTYSEIHSAISTIADALDMAHQSTMHGRISEWAMNRPTDNLPDDWENPDWNNIPRVHDWKNYPSTELINIWDTFSENQKMVLSSCFQQTADLEDWE